MYQGTAQKVISKTNLKSIKIPIPSLDKQREIVEYCEFNCALIQQLEQEIENNKKQAQQFIAGIVKSHVRAEDQVDTSSVNAEESNEVQDKITSAEDAAVIEPNQTVKIMVRKKVKRTLIAQQENAV